MDNPEKRETLGTQNTRRRQTKKKTKKHNTTCWTRSFRDKQLIDDSDEVLLIIIRQY